MNALVFCFVATVLAKNQLLCSNVTAPTSFAKWIAPFSILVSAFVHDTSSTKCDTIFGKHTADASACRDFHCPTKFDRSQFSTIEIASWTQCANISDDRRSITILVEGFAFAAPKCGTRLIKRRAVLGRLLQWTGYNISWAPDAAMPREYVSWAVHGAEVVVNIENNTSRLPISTGTYGHFEAFFKFDLPFALSSTTRIHSVPMSLSVAGCNKAHTSLPTMVDTLIVPPTGLTVISDIDDILRVSEIWDPKQAFLDLWVRPFQPWLNMPDIFSLWRQAVPNAHFHYTSDVPELSSRFYAEGTSNHYPNGSFDFRPTVFTSFAQVSAPRYHNIRRQLETFPRRKFVLLGDTSTSSTLSAYARLANEFPDQVQCIMIRRVEAIEPANWIVPELAPFRKLRGKALMYTVPADLDDTVGLMRMLAGGGTTDRNGSGDGCGGFEMGREVDGHGAAEAWAATLWNVASWYTQCWLLGSRRPHAGCRFDRRVELGRQGRGWMDGD